MSTIDGDSSFVRRAACCRRIRLGAAVLQELCRRRGSYRTGRGEEFLDAEQNAVVARDAQRYCRAMYYGGEESWNIRDRHMMSTLRALMRFHGPAARRAWSRHTTPIWLMRAPPR
ncbi:erythromycin esterase family protein [Kribbella sp. NPDC026611]|uniref:erythromycin esterase family protein n=1 Tax=Kribbella sp. NPDC026611 TaxID=3154911 RepID=UPI0033D7930F